MSSSSTFKGVERKTTRAAKEATQNPLIENIARFGHIARGAIYGVIGLLAMQLAFVGNGQVTDQTGAIQYLDAQPFGKVLLMLLIIGLVGYSLWGLIRAFLDPLHRGHDAKGLVTRFGYLVSAVSYGALTLVPLYYLTGFGSPSASKPQDISAQLFAQPYGRWLVGILGLFWIAGAIGQLYVAWKLDFMRDLRGDLDANERELARVLGRVGYAARGIVFGLIGWFLLQAAMTANPNQAVGLDGALLKLAQQPYGVYLLGAVAFGLLLFGIFSSFCARWIRIPNPPS